MSHHLNLLFEYSLGYFMSVNHRFSLFCASILTLTCLAGCGNSGPEVPYNTEEIVEIMNTLDEQAYVIWGNSGSEWDADGERELFPTTDEGWKELELAANELVAIGQSLKGMVNTSDPRADAWLAYADGIEEVSQTLITAAATQDKAATFDQGGVLYQVCKACHGTFPSALEENRP